jgi:hypothetical protein
MHLVHRFGADAEFAFLSRSSDELCRVFVSTFPDIPTRSLDISRRLAGDERMASMFAFGITPATVFVDMVGSGRSFFRFSESTGNPGRALILFAFLEGVLSGTERKKPEIVRKPDASRTFSTSKQPENNGHSSTFFSHIIRRLVVPVSI